MYSNKDITSHLPLPLQGRSLSPGHGEHFGPNVLIGQQTETKCNTYTLIMFIIL